MSEFLDAKTSDPVVRRPRTGSSASPMGPVEVFQTIAGVSVISENWGPPRSSDVDPAQRHPLGITCATTSMR